LLIVEPHWEGHHLRYLRWIAREAAARGYDVWLATSADTLEHTLYHTLLKECGGRIRVETLPADGTKPPVRGAAGIARLEFHYRSMFAGLYKRLSKEERPDYVLVPYLDYCAYATALLGSPFGDTPWGGIIMRPTFHLSEADVGVSGSAAQRVKERLFFRLLRDRHLRALFTLDDLLVRHVRRKRQDLAARLRFLPEPAELEGSRSRDEARQMLGVPGDATVVLVYGHLDSSKGIDALLAATSESQFPEGMHLLLAGHQNAEVKALLASPRAEELRRAGRLHELDRFLYGEDEYAVFRAADVAWVGYQGQYISSGVLIQAAMAGLPVISCEEGLIGWLTREHKLGFTVPISDARTVAEAVSRLTHEPELSAWFGENGERFATVHKVDNFTRSIGEELLWNFPPLRR
jgi:glycosyltransferase involved in cell wall biosynthesis